MYGNNILLVTESELKHLHDAVRHAPESGCCAWLPALVRKLKGAVVIPPSVMPPDVVTMHSMVRLAGPNREAETWRLVYPHEVHLADHHVSVLAPGGAALLGMRAGGTLLWGLDWGCTVVTVESVEQPPDYPLTGRPAEAACANSARPLNGGDGITLELLHGG